MSKPRQLHRVLSVLLCLCMLAGMLPAYALAADSKAAGSSELTKGSSIEGTDYSVTSLKNYAIAPDISEKVIITNNAAGNSQTVANVMEVNTAGGRAKIVAGYGNRNPKEQGWTLKTTTDQAHVYEKETGLNVVGGVNASWFNINTGEPSGYLVMNGVVHHDNSSRAFIAAYDGGPWQEGMELAALPVFRNTTRMDVANGFRTGGGDYAQLRRTMEQLAAAVGADVAQSAVEVRVPDETVQAAMEDAWAGETWQCGVTFAVRGGPTELALTWKDVTVTVGESGELWVKLSRPELAALTPDAAAAWLLEQYGAIFGEQTRYFMAARDSGGCSLYFYRPEEDLTQGILQRSILKTWVRLSGGSCEVRLYRPELSDANTVGAYPLVTVDQARQRLAAGQHLSAWEPFPGEDRVKRVDLQYLARQTDRYFMPYYVFWVECDDGEQGVCYRPYYVPAVADAYIAGMPQSPTGAA